MVSSQLKMPLSMASITNSSVITLVTDAGASRSWAFSSYKIVPVAASIRMAEGAVISTVAAETGMTNTPSNIAASTSRAPMRFFMPIRSFLDSVQAYVPGGRLIPKSSCTSGKKAVKMLAGGILYEIWTLYAGM